MAVVRVAIDSGQGSERQSQPSTSNSRLCGKVMDWFWYTIFIIVFTPRWIKKLLRRKNFVSEKDVEKVNELVERNNKKFDLK